METPVTQLASSLAKNTATLAISSGAPNPLNGWAALMALAKSESPCNKWEINGVSISAKYQHLTRFHSLQDINSQPGQIALQWIRNGAKSNAAALVKLMIDPLEAQYD